MSVIRNVRISNSELPLSFQHAFDETVSLAGLPSPQFKNWVASASIAVTTSTPQPLTLISFDRASRFITGLPSQGYVAGVRFWSVEEGSTWYGVQWSSTRMELFSHSVDIPTEASKSTALQLFPFISPPTSPSLWFFPIKQDGLNYLCVSVGGYAFSAGFFIVPFPKNVTGGKEKIMVTADRVYGFRYANTTSVTYANLNVYDLPDRIDYLTFDPGESPMAAIMRATEGLDMSWFSRRNGSFSVYRTRDRTGDAVLWGPSNVLDSTVFAKDNRQLISHVRVVGAYAEADVIDYENLAVVGHVYTEVNNPYLLSNEEAQTEAIRIIRRNKQDANTLSFTTDHNPTMEPDDKISYLDLSGVTTSWLVNSVSISVEAGKPFYQFTCRRAV